MKAIIKKTGEIVDVYHESQHGTPKMIYKESVMVNSRMWAEDELELITNDEDDKHWQDVKERAAIAALQGLLANPHSFYSSGTMKEGIVSEAYYKGHALAGRLEEAQKEKQKERIGAKKVDFAKEFDDFTKELRIPNEFPFFSDIEKTARFFFQLGLKAQK